MCGCESRDSSATYAEPAFVCDASMTLMPPGGMFFGVTLVQVRPLSRVTCTRPVLVPTQISPFATGDGASDWIVPPAAGPPPRPVCAGGACPAGGAVRSGLIARQVRAPSFDARTYCAAMYSVCGSFGENASGGAPPKRSSGVG